ncbi:histidine--tRNA ligase [Candidatus Kaiserbacteria bacterium]|nr:histidine--tRNA ligase [Candidatus Kaiserbacteria bacterium]
MKDTTLGTGAYKGVRDFYPKDMYVERYMFDTMSRAAESFGYSEYGASVLEPVELYKSKSSEEIVSEQTYTFTDRGGREVTLRPEMTPTVARMVAARERELTFPLRWYTIANMFRYERPQRGRMREHWQLNADIFGVPDIEAEVEIIALSSSIMKAFGAHESDFEIRVSDRSILFSLFDELALSQETQKQLLLLLDKKDRAPHSDIELEKLLGDKTSAFREKIKRASSSTELELLIKRLKGVGVTNAIVDTSIVRAFNYYTGIVFEVFDTSGENKRSLFGGGRYDNLLELFGKKKIPAVGFGMGDITLRDFLETHELLPEYVPRTDLYLCTLSEKARGYAQALAQELRAQDINVEVSLSVKRVGDQVAVASAKSIPFVICIGEDEMKSKEFTIKELKGGKEKVLLKETIADYIFSHI